ncbi:MAG: tryptophan 2,3-dioxygenase [Acidobacteriota bacterium]|nr:tryptophan 2,3-dioxygenase [Acidobacteriota bacterium]MDE3043524.1 tryptophan 2,3-dioxygenase [Acidobacteriota bacterium]MDE3106627.1 tryptophan 2,3-dioxygenase [Acidobacteriota bacterium]MDE3223377.1 tryptophan 2,3-dioxygenase [Acidobacteriota bacterium]
MTSELDGTDYSSYLRINDLLKLQIPLSVDAKDELLFIVVHQSYELWFKVIIDELRRAIRELGDDAPWRAIAHLRRTVGVEDLLIEHLRVLETMSPEAFLEFRDPLNPASGFQSVQFRAIEFLSGAGRPAMLQFELFDVEQRAWLARTAAETNLWRAFEDALRREFVAPEVEVLELLRLLYGDHARAARGALHAVAELLMDHDERLAMWRHQHVLMAGRQIGRRPGTGGSAGMAYLETTLASRLYPELWEVRSVL